MWKNMLVLGLVLSVVHGARADIACTATKTVPKQNRTRMKHRTPPTGSSSPILTTVGGMIAASPAIGTATAGFRTAVGPIDPRENAVLTLKGDLWAINIEPNDCDFHLEVSEVGGSVDADRVIVEIPQTAPFVAARNALLNKLHAAGVTLHARTKLTHPIRVQILGFSFYDACTSAQRIHNVETTTVRLRWARFGRFIPSGRLFSRPASEFRHDASVSGSEP
jgi:hypothetical protein